MKTYVCQVCGHIAFDQAPVNCPVCIAAIENFESDDAAVRKPIDPDNLNEMEQKHLPDIIVSADCPIHDGNCTAVQVNVGVIPHVMECEHHIEFIDLYVNRKYITRVSLTAKRIYPLTSVHLAVGEGVVSVIARCNVHGSWRSKVRLANEGPPTHIGGCS